MRKKSSKITIGWLIAAGLIILGIIIYTGIPGFDFSAYICFGCSIVVICYLLLGLFSKRHPQIAKILLIILSVPLCLGIVAAAITGSIIIHASAGQQVSCDYVVVLGAGVNGTVPSLSLQERINAAYDYLCAYPEAICVVSGGQGNGEDISEAQCMYNELTRMGIAAERVWMEDQATDTRENLRFSLDLIEEKTGIRPVEIGLVSSEYHLYRAGLFAREENVTSYGIPARTSWVTLRINYYLREIAAVWYYTILGG